MKDYESIVSLATSVLKREAEERGWGWNNVGGIDADKQTGAVQLDLNVEFQQTGGGGDVCCGYCSRKRRPRYCKLVGARL